ncbi:hypothetical protein FB45DRAFT_939358 [Roridomyces roridus]|uniref:Uncharacterized protein n=1 Tax=Roridomyces roridus TaxID=1738132 RepID=A0AAD7B7Z1_9AGAR|nr:hypothetical protein FB45DRAFT_939358 [Roridomyces roridus]
MLLLGTTHAALGLTRDIVYFRYVQKSARAYAPSQTDPLFRKYKALALTQNVIFAGNNLLTDAFLLYRCYLIWNCRLWVIVFPGILMIAAFIPALLQSLVLIEHFSLLKSLSSYLMATVTNMILTGLIAGRIWWKKHEVSHYTESYESILRMRYATAMKIILESGALYCTTSVLLIATTPLKTGPVWYFHSILFALGWQIVNIIPPVALVRGTQQSEDGKSSPGEESGHPMVLVNLGPRSANANSTQPSDVSSEVIYIRRKSGESAVY